MKSLLIVTAALLTLISISTASVSAMESENFEMKSITEKTSGSTYSVRGYIGPSGFLEGDYCMRASIGFYGYIYPFVVSVTPATKGLQVGDSFEFTAEAIWFDGGTTIVTEEATWNVSNDTVGSVDGTGNFTAAEVGTTYVNASYEGYTGSAEVTVTTEEVVEVESVTVSPATVALQTPVTSYSFTAEASWTNGTTMDVTEEATWWLSNGSALNAEISNGEFVQTTEATGTTYVNASYEGLTGSAFLTLTTEAEETEPDDVNDIQEQVVSKYNTSFDWTTQTPDQSIVVDAVTTAIGDYFDAPEGSAERQTIVDDVIQMVSLYFSL